MLKIRKVENEGKGGLFLKLVVCGGGMCLGGFIVVCHGLQLASQRLSSSDSSTIN